MQIQRHHYCRSAAAGILIVLLAACGMDASATSSLPTFEATVTPSKTVTKTLTPTATMDTTFAYWATAQDATFSAESTKSILTQEAILGLAKQFPHLCGFDRQGVTVSANEEWIATDCRFDEEVFRVFRTQGDQVWDVPYSEVMKYYPESIGSVRALHWTSDGMAVYFTSSSCCADTGAITNGDALYRLDLLTGKWTQITEAPFSYYSFSPDGRHLIYLANNQPNANDYLRLHLLDLGSKQGDFIDADGFGQGWIAWKGDGQKIALFAQNRSIYQDTARFSLVIVDLMNKSQQPVILNTEDGLDITDWSNDDILTIRRSNLMEYNDYYVNVPEIVFYDLKTNHFITSTPTP